MADHDMARDVERVTRFLESAFRNIDLPPLSKDDVTDIVEGLREYALTASRSYSDEIEEKAAFIAVDEADTVALANEAVGRDDIAKAFRKLGDHIAYRIRSISKVKDQV